jgi:hypothetical protein
MPAPARRSVYRIESVIPLSAGRATHVRVKVEGGVIVFPMSAKGKRVSAQGVWKVAGASHGVAPDPNAPKRYQLKDTSAVIR